MGEYTREYKSKIRHQMRSGTRHAKIQELVFLAVFLGGAAFLMGYLYGSYHPFQTETQPWAEKLGTIKHSTKK